MPLPKYAKTRLTKLRAVNWLSGCFIHLNNPAPGLFGLSGFPARPGFRIRRLPVSDSVSCLAWPEQLMNYRKLIGFGASRGCASTFSASASFFNSVN